MSFFRKTRGKQPEGTPEVPRAGATIRPLKEPESIPEPATSAVVGVDQGRGDFNVTVQVRNDFEALEDIEQRILDRVSSDLAQRVADDLDRSIMFGEGTTPRTATQVSQERRRPERVVRSYRETANRINLEVPDWGVDGQMGDVYYRNFTPRADMLRMERGPITQYALAEQGYQGSMEFSARSPESRLHAYAAASVAAQQLIVERGLSSLVSAIEDQIGFMMDSWLQSFIFSPDGIPALCGIVVGRGDRFSVVGGSLRNEHLYPPEYFQTLRDARRALETFIARAIMQAQPELAGFIRRYG